MTAAPRTERPTLRTIAKMSGLAVATVSRALSDAPDISADTKLEVRRIANEIGYIPNRAGVRLRTGRTQVISLILGTNPDTLNMTERLISSVAQALNGTGYHLNVTPEMPGEDPLDAVRYVVETRSADAVIINRTQPDDPRVRYLQEKGFPFVTHGRSRWADTHAWFDFDNEAFGRIATETLIARGRRSLLMLPPPLDQNYAKDMVRGAEAAMAHHPDIRFELITAASSDSPHEQMRHGILAALARHAPVDALISPTPQATLIATPLLESGGQVIGHDVDLFSKETFPILDYFRPAILSMPEDIGKAGAFMARAALHEIERRGEGRPMQEMDGP